MIAEDNSTNSDASSHDYARLENADTNRATWIDHTDVDATEDFESTNWRKTHKRTYFRYLNDLNAGFTNGIRRNKPFYTYQANLHLCGALVGTLELTPTQKSEAQKWFRVLDFRKIGHPTEVTAFCICARLVHEDEGDVRCCYPQTPMEEWPSEFREMYESWSGDYQNRYSGAYGQIDHQIRNWSYEDNEPASSSMDRFGLYDAQLIQTTPA